MKKKLILIYLNTECLSIVKWNIRLEQENVQINLMMMTIINLIKN